MLQGSMKVSPTYSPNSRVLLKTTKPPLMFWSKDLAEIDQMVKSSNMVSFASSQMFLYFPLDHKEKTKGPLCFENNDFCVGREVTGFLDLGKEFCFLDMPECELLTFQFPKESTFEDLEVRDKEIRKELSTEYRDRLKARRISMVGNQAGSGLDDLRVELQYFFGWT